MEAEEEEEVEVEFALGTAPVLALVEAAEEEGVETLPNISNLKCRANFHVATCNQMVINKY